MTMVINTRKTADDFKISQYLIFEILNNSHSIYLKTKTEIEKYNIIHRLPRAANFKHTKVQLTKFLPLLEISAQTYEYLKRPVDFFLKSVDGQKEKTMENYKLYSLKNNLWLKIIFEACEGLFTQYMSIESKKLFFSKDFYDIVRSIPVLTFLLFCAFRNHCIERRNVFDIENIELQISDARDISEGVLQIVENIVYHSQKHKGYFSLRIHDRYKKDEHNNAVENSYLISQYDNYFKHDKRKDFKVFLEIFVVDGNFGMNSSEQNILTQRFIQNLKIRSEKAAYLKKYIEDFSLLTMADFFDPNKWSQYYAQQENIIEHYGISLFDKIVTSYDGYFELISASNFKTTQENYYCSESFENETKDIISGTQYRILLPISQRNFAQAYTGIDFQNLQKEDRQDIINGRYHIQTRDLSDFIKEALQKVYNISDQKTKKEVLVSLIKEDIYQIMQKYILSKNLDKIILQFLIGKRTVDIDLIEIIFKGFLKALSEFRILESLDRPIYIVFGNLTQDFLSEFSRLIGIYYYKVGRSEIMKHTQLYIWTGVFYEDLIISGETLDTVRNYIYHRAARKGIYPSWLSFLNYIWKKCVNNPETSIKQDPILPYEIMIKYKKQTLFEHIVDQTLTTPIEGEKLGCYMDDVHVQIGSRIHVTEFFDGLSLFQNNYFSANYAYLIVKRFADEAFAKAYLKDVDAVLLVGHESYSEMLLMEIKLLMEKLFIYQGTQQKILPYIIAESVNDNVKFRTEKGQVNEIKFDIEEQMRSLRIMFIFIVPINSTLMTFAKLKQHLQLLFHISLDYSNTSMNFALIITRDNKKEWIEKSDEKCGTKLKMTEREHLFWSRISEKERVITINNKEEICYFNMVYGGWESAIECKKCFPNRIIDERPLTKTNRTGLSPMIQLGRKHKGNGNIDAINIKRLKNLSKTLIYRHIKRKDNHYLYYFDTNQYYADNKIEIECWLESIKQNVACETSQYHFIVAPLHDSNAGFVECVNHTIFGNAAHIIRLEFNKTYRSNFHIQYSYLKLLYNNLSKAAKLLNDDSEINFYFVDDEIISGKTFLRAKSLLESLLKGGDIEKKVHVNIFKRIFVLIDRLSDATKESYINNYRDNFCSYVKFNISAIQNHDDFCYMCTLVDNATGQKFMSSSNEMDRTWKDIEENFSVQDYTKVKKETDCKTKEKYQNRMIAAHYAEAAFQRLHEGSTIGDYCICIIDELLYKRMSKRNGEILCNESNRQIFISYLKALSRPFLVYRNNVKEAVLKLLLVFMEIFLGEVTDNVTKGTNEFAGCENKFQKICNVLVKWRDSKDEGTYDLLIDFMEQLTDIDSNYIIRKKSIVKIFDLYKSIPLKRRKSSNKKEKVRNDFELQYLDNM